MARATTSVYWWATAQGAVARLVNSLQGVSARRLRQRDRVRSDQEHLWSLSYSAASADGAALETLKMYIHQQHALGAVQPDPTLKRGLAPEKHGHGRGCNASPPGPRRPISMSPRCRTAKQAAGLLMPLEGKALAIASAVAKPAPVNGERRSGTHWGLRTPEEGGVQLLPMRRFGAL
jgi:hypothetical protein